jgi:hypothetical protein
MWPLYHARGARPIERRADLRDDFSQPVPGLADHASNGKIMPKPVGSESPATHTIDLEPVVITGRATKAAASVPVPIGDIALQCSDEGASVAVAVLSTAANPAIGLIASAGAGAALGACVTQTVIHAETEASIRRALDRCLDAGGTPAGVIDHTLTCLVTE